jgi:hypothetical protein
MDQPLDHESLDRQGAKQPEQGALPPCCGSGCTVCVLDYPELFQECAAPATAPSALGLGASILLEAIEEAARTLRRLESGVAG